MRAALYYGKTKVQLEDIAEPDLSPNERLVEVEWCGLCGSDLHLYSLGPDVFGELTKNDGTLPYSLGHEFCGRVRSPPAGCGLQDGDPVMIDPRLPCWSCVACKAGKEYSCARQGGIGYSRAGGFAERVAVPIRNIHRLPDTVPLSYAALIEPFSIAVHAIRMSGVTNWPTQRVLVLGGGPLGFALIIALRAHSPRTIIVSEPTSIRREQVSDHVDLTLNPLVDDVVDRCNELTESEGIDVVIDCAGSSAGLIQGLDALKCEGLYLNLAMYEQPMTLPVFTVLSKHITIKSAMVYGTADFEETIRLFAEGKFRGYEQMVTKRIGLDDIVRHGFQELIDHKDSHIKILVTPKRIDNESGK